MSVDIPAMLLRNYFQVKNVTQESLIIDTQECLLFILRKDHFLQSRTFKNPNDKS